MKLNTNTIFSKKKKKRLSILLLVRKVRQFSMTVIFNFKKFQ